MMIGLLVVSMAGEANAKPKRDPLLPACIGDFESIEKDLRKRDASSDAPAAVQLSEYIFEQDASGELLETVKAACWDASYDAGEKAFFLPALQCVGDAAALAAELGRNRDDNHLDSYCAFDAMAQLAERTAPDDDSLEATSQAGRAAALVELRRSDRDLAQAYGNFAVEAYERANEAEPTQDRLFALASLYIDLKKPAKAEQVIAKLDGGKKALALVSLADLKRRKKASASDVLAILNRAKQAAPRSQTVNSALGETHLELENLSDARESFLAVIDDKADEDAGREGPGMRADAYYYLAVLDARTAKATREWASVEDNARRAYDIIGGDVRYRRLLCLAYIGKGFYRMRRDTSAPFCEGQESAEGKLLYGLYQLRKAQYVPVRLLGGGRT
ncbi:MAG: hypothetical protein AAF602_06435, partial [Myxococcota bacterium]